MDGRVKKMNKEVNGGMIEVRKEKENVEEMEEKGIGGIDIEVINIYKLEEVRLKGGE